MDGKNKNSDGTVPIDDAVFYLNLYSKQCSLNIDMIIEKDHEYIGNKIISYSIFLTVISVI